MEFSDVDITRVYLTLGLACNLNCRYCIQSNERRGLSKRPSDRVIAYLQHLADIRPRWGRTLPTSISVTLFGGEPLLYFDAAREVVERVNRENIIWLMETNGLLLTDPVVDFCNEHGIKVVVSNDGPESEKTRGVNVFEKDAFLRCFNRLEKRGIECVLTSYSQDLYRSWDYWRERVGEVPVTAAFLIPNQDYPKDLTTFDLPAWQETCRRLSDEAVVGLCKHKETPALRMMRPYMDSYFEHVQGRALYPRCEAYGHLINLDLEGNTYLCHSGMGRFGSLGTSTTKLAREARIRFLDLHRENRRQCLACRWMVFCKALCPFARPGAQATRICEFMSIFYEAVAQTMKRVETEFSTPVEL